MPKPSTYPERIGVRLPAGTSARIRAALGVPEGEEPGYGQIGDYLRQAVLERLAKDEGAACGGENAGESGG